jgi:hypothetical protein
VCGDRRRNCIDGKARRRIEEADHKCALVIDVEEEIREAGNHADCDVGDGADEVECGVGEGRAIDDGRE